MSITAASLPDLPPSDIPLRAPLCRASRESLDEASRQLGIPLPASYRAFAERYGLGIACRVFLFFMPQEPDESALNFDLVQQSKALQRDLRIAVREGSIGLEPDGSEEIVARLVPFGINTADLEDPDVLAWDPGQPSAPDEFWIYIVGLRRSYVRRAAPDLGSFLRRVLVPNTGGMLLDAMRYIGPRALAATFDPL